MAEKKLTKREQKAAAFKQHKKKKELVISEENAVPESDVIVDKKEDEKVDRKRPAEDSEENQPPRKKKNRRPKKKTEEDKQNRFIVFVGNLPYDITKEDLEKHFESAGGIRSVRMLTDKQTKKPKGFAFLEFETSKNLHRQINVELTAGGGGNKSESRKEKLKTKNERLQEERIVNPNAALDSEGNDTLDILEYHRPWTASEVYADLASYGPKGRQAYLSLLMFDCGFLLTRTVPICLLVYWAFRRAPQWCRPGVWIPLATTAVDLTENALIYGLLKLYPRRVDAAAQLVAYSIQLKWVLLWATVAVLSIGLLVGIYFGFHGLLADSVLLENDKKDRVMAKRHVNAALLRASGSNASSSAAAQKKKDA
ncbi:hypothetical protein DFQ28_007235 [Apophysomyces sp. BC1034]|nr:hypothetical protein DFQ30_006331 [Apophysomyces sp. BC1015]KAG0182274.1 hypothetical protein DFQ29_005004 [Apophysomyces sp. BC1021]KAG0192893.1 hypothetical protein DFQ28_007235 [Apophysomyces sp. BC1034]